MYVAPRIKFKSKESCQWELGA